MNPILQRDNYLVIPNFLLPEKALHLGALFDAFCEGANAHEDLNVPKSTYFANHMDFVDLLCLSTVRVSRMAGVPVLPTYTYTRAYTEGADLKPHRDREACEISITLCIDESGPVWPIFMTKPDGSVSSLSLFPGDAVMYLGCRSAHWRTPCPTSKYKQAFLHYVRADGPFADEAFEYIRTAPAPR